jgi:hypothetical protein
MGQNLSDIIFISAQPDVPYFHWQIEVYINNFIDKGINSNQIYVLFSSVNGSERLSEGATKLLKYTPNIFFYSDDRDKKHYIPSIKPYLLYKFLQEHPNKGKLLFLHDSDIVFNTLPEFEDLINDPTQYLSDTTGYLNFEYIMDCDQRYFENHSDKLEKGMLLREMVDVVGVDPSLVKKNSKNSGGAQYLLKNQTWFVWYKIYKDSTLLYDKMKRYHHRYPIKNGEIQFWTAEMWSILWNLWWWGYDTKVVDQLKFCWATDSINKCDDHPILHMAGITQDMGKDHFFKGDFIDKNPLSLLNEDPNFFDFIKINSSTNRYIDVMKKIIQK